jgi:hypothetical protein
MTGAPKQASTQFPLNELILLKRKTQAYLKEKPHGKPFEKRVQRTSTTNLRILGA